MQAARNSRQTRWTIVASVAMIAFVIGGLCSVSIGFFILPWMTDFGWPSGLTSSIATAFNLATLLAAPAAGLALDRLGARPVMAVGVLTASAAFALASRCDTQYGMLVAFTLAGVGYCASFYVPGAVVVTHWMESKKNIGMGIVGSALSLGAASFSLLLGRWIEAYGWRSTMALIAAVVAVMLPVILFTVTTRPQRPPPILEHPLPNSNPRRARRDLLSSRFFIIATASAAMFAIGTGGTYYHVVSLLIKAGYSAHFAGLAFGVSWLLTALGSLVFGAIADRVGPKAILAGAFFACTIGTLFLLGAGDSRMGSACVVAFVVLWGAPGNSAFQFLPVIFAERFGFLALGTLIGVQSAIAGIAGAAAPIATGLLYDRSNDYRLAVCLSALATFVAFALVLLLKVPRRGDSVLAIRGSKEAT